MYTYIYIHTYMLLLYTELNLILVSYQLTDDLHCPLAKLLAENSRQGMNFLHRRQAVTGDAGGVVKSWWSLCCGPSITSARGVIIHLLGGSKHVWNVFFYVPFHIDGMSSETHWRSPSFFEDGFINHQPVVFKRCSLNRKSLKSTTIPLGIPSLSERTGIAIYCLDLKWIREGRIS